MICGNPGEEFETAPDKKRYRRCLNCGYIYLLPSFHPGPDAERERYLKHQNSPENSGYVSYLDGIIEDRILPLAPSFNRILDFGSGPNPVFAHLLEQRGFRAAIYDPFFAPDTGIWRNQYDLITLIEVAEHLADPLTVLKNLAELLSPGGFLFISTLLYEDKTDFAAWWYRMDATHLGFFTESAMRWIARELSCGEPAITGGKFITLAR